MCANCGQAESPAKRIDVTNLPPDFWRSDSGTKPPDNVADYDDTISHKGPIVVGALDPVNPGKVATFAGDIDVLGQIDPNSIVFSDAPAGVTTAFNSAALGYYKIGVIGTQRTIVLMPIADAIEAVQTRRADGATVVTSVDTLNKRFAINNADPAAAIDVNGAVINWLLNLPDIAVDGTLGPAAATVDLFTNIAIAQTTADVDVILPAPTLTRSGRLLRVANVGNVPVKIDGNPVLPGKGIPFVWSGAVWIPYGSSSADFWRSGNGATLPDGTTDTVDSIAHNGDVGIGIVDPTTLAARLDVAGAEVLRPVTLANFTANSIVGPSALTVDIASILIIPQTTQDIVLSLPAPAKTQAGRLLIVKNTGSAAFSMLSNKVWPGSHAVFVWNGAAWLADKHAPYSAPIVITGSITLEPVRHHYEILEYAGATNITITLPSTLPVGFQASFTQAGTGRIIFAAGAGMAIGQRWGADRTAGQWAKAGIEVRVNGGCVLSGDVV